MNYTPLNINNKVTKKSNWFIKQKISSSIILNSELREEYVKTFVPDHFVIDKFNGSPIISVIVYANESLSFKYLPFLKKKKSTHVQLRTYIKRNGVPGIFILSLDTNHPSLNTILKPLTDLPLFDSNIKRTTAASSTQIDLIRDGFQLYANIESSEQRVFPGEELLLDWCLNRFHIFNMQKDQVVEWKLDQSPPQVFKAKLKNIQFNHSIISNDLVNFSDSTFTTQSSILRIWPPSLPTL